MESKLNSGKTRIEKKWQCQRTYYMADGQSKCIWEEKLANVRERLNGRAEVANQELVFRVQRGDKGAFDLLVLKYQQRWPIWFRGIYTIRVKHWI